MQPWVYGLMFIALSLMLAVAIDRHVYRSHRALTRPAPVRLAQRPTPGPRLRPAMPPMARPAGQTPSHRTAGDQGAS